jgi:hypothetical protein
MLNVKRIHHLKAYPTQNFDSCSVDVYQMFLNWIFSKKKKKK